MTDRGANGGIRHAAWFYRTPAEYLAMIEDFIAAGLVSGDPVLAAVPAGRLPADWSPPSGPDVTVVDMAESGRNPARIIPLLHEFCLRYPGRPVRYLGEPAYPERSAAALQEAGRHEALINLAFASADISILCSYDARMLPQSVLSDARCTHPVLLQRGTDTVSPDYLDPADYLVTMDKPLLAPTDADSLEYQRDLRPVRAMIAAVGQRSGLSPQRCADLVIAASEVAANTLRHAGGSGVVRIWSAAAEVLCQLEDGGYIANPLAGHWRPPDDMTGGQGLWLVNQVCDLAEISTSKLGTTIRLHMSLSG